MSKKSMYNGYPLAVYLDFKDGSFLIYDRQKKTYGKKYASFNPAKKHALEWNRIYKRRKR